MGPRGGASSRACGSLAGGVATGLLSLVYYNRWIDRPIRPSKLIGPGPAALAEYEAKTMARDPLARQAGWRS